MMEVSRSCLFIHIFGLILFFPGSLQSSCTTSESELPRFGDKCQYECHCVNKSEQCDVITGNCVDACDFEWVGAGCQFKNIAYNKKSRHDSNTYHPYYYSDLANDNDLSTCSYTSENNTYVHWWNLWLPEYTTFRKFEFVTTSSHLANFQNFGVLVYNTTYENFYAKGTIADGLLCYQHNYTMPLLDTKIQVTCDGFPVGNLIRLKLPTNVSQLVLCDFRLYEDCKNSFYGNGCERCSDNCLPFQSRSCSSNDGSCWKGCKSGWRGDRCEHECKDGKWGPDCQNDCGNCLSSSCDHVNGSCREGCIPGYQTTNECKTECAPGYFGKDCKEQCNPTCTRSDSPMCNNVNGSCMNGCLEGYKGSYCEFDITGKNVTLDKSNHDVLAMKKFGMIILGSVCVVIVLYATVITVLFLRRSAQTMDIQPDNRVSNLSSLTNAVVESAGKTPNDTSPDMNEDSHDYMNLDML